MLFHVAQKGVYRLCPLSVSCVGPHLVDMYVALCEVVRRCSLVLWVAPSLYNFSLFGSLLLPPSINC